MQYCNNTQLEWLELNQRQSSAECLCTFLIGQNFSLLGVSGCFWEPSGSKPASKCVTAEGCCVHLHSGFNTAVCAAAYSSGFR